MEVISEINSSLTCELSSYLASRFPSRLFHLIFSKQSTRSSIEIVDLIDSECCSPDLLWTKLMRIELIKSL